MSNHDPFSYGQVRLGTDKQPVAETPDELLFADAGPTKKAPPADSNWEPLDDELAGGRPGAGQDPAAIEFGAEILGEAPSRPVSVAKQAPSPKQPATRPPQPRAAVPAPRVLAAPPVAAKTAKQEPASTVAQAPAPAPRLPARPMHGPRSMPQRSSRLSSTLAPAAMFACGGTASAWLFAMEQDVVMAGIVGALSLTATVFLRVWLRR